MTSEEYNLIYQNINNNNIIEDFYVISKFIFSINSNTELLKECFSLLKIYSEIIEYEMNLYDIIINNKVKIDYQECRIIMRRIGDLNKQTIMYFNYMISIIKDAYAKNEEIKLNYSNKDFKFINENNDYLNEVIGLTIDFDFEKNFLNYPDAFWNYIKSKIRFVDSRGDEKHILYETIMHFDENNCLDDMRVFVPKIINLLTALINVHEFKHAYDLYHLLGKQVTYDVTEFEETASQKEKEFIKYLSKRDYL